MRRKILAGALALSMLFGFVTLGWAASQENTLVSLSYLNGAYLTDLKAYITQWVTQNTQGIYNDAAAKAGQGSGTAGDTGGVYVSSTFVAGTGAYGDTVTLTTGSGLIWTSGSAAVSAGALVDATAGTEAAAGSRLTAGHRYLAGAETTIVVSSQSAQWMAEGSWTRGAGGTVDIPLPFTDVSTGDSFYNAVKWNYDNNFIKGTSATTFRPYNTITRGQIVLILYRHAGSPPVTAGASTYSDLPANDEEMGRAILWATEKGIVQGYGNGLFGPKNNVRNQELAKILYLYNALRGGSTAGTVDLNATFTDSADISAWAAPYVQWAVANGVMGAYDSTNFRPQTAPMRCRVAVNIYNYGTRFGI